MQHAVDDLRGHGRGFVMTLTTTAGRPIEADGRAIGGRAVLRLRDVGGIERELIDLATRHDALLADVETLRALVDSLPTPVWARDESGRLIFVNAAYARAVEAVDAADAVARELELLDSAAREDVLRARATGARYSGRLPAVVAGERRSFEVIDAPSGSGRAGIAIDRTEAETMRAGMARLIIAHRRVLDRLATGVAIFAADGKLTFYNVAFRSLFELDPGFLDQSADRYCGARSPARQPQAAGGAGLPAMEKSVARSLSFGRAEGTSVAPARRAYAARGHYAQSGRRRHLPL